MTIDEIYPKFKQKYRKALVTGGAGFIGSNFVHFWLKKYPKDKIIVLDKLTYAGSRDNLIGIENKIKFVRGDICDKNLVEKIFSEEKPDIVLGS
jgi:dTDP-glucose 4,6-dehydratase